VKIRVHFRDESSEDYDANLAEVFNDGSLRLSKRTEKESGLVNAAGQKQLEVTFLMVRIIRRDLWAEVELIDAGEPQVIEVGRREPVLAVN
jgi:hypothetical protein